MSSCNQYETRMASFFRVGIERTEGESPNAYSAATFVSKPAPAPVETPAKVVEESSSDSD